MHATGVQWGAGQHWLPWRWFRNQTSPPEDVTEAKEDAMKFKHILMLTLGAAAVAALPAMAQA
ncbi:hypothetical protein L2221_13085, partial [Xanthomonas perforans]|nr:hypothetical protein [Xanthomonas perforans]